MDNLVFSFVGDIMPGGELQGVNEVLSSEVSELLNKADLRIGTLECAFGEGLTFDRVKMADRQNVVYTINSDILKLKKMNIDIVSLANNHIFDLGEEGLRNVIQLLKENNIAFCGAGLNYDEASRPVIKELNGKKFAFLANCALRHVGYIPIASDNSPGIALLDPIKVCEQIVELKRQVDYVFVLPHWGEEGVYWPHIDLIKIGKLLVDAGADAIIGSHSHQVQPIFKYKGKPIFFSLGNFLFPDFYMDVPRPIFYPNTEEKVSIQKITHTYPFPISEPMKMVWPNKRRIGMIGNLCITIDDNVEFDYTYSRLDTNNEKVYLLEASEVQTVENQLRYVRLANKINYTFFWKLSRFKKRCVKRLAIIFKYETEIY